MKSVHAPAAKDVNTVKMEKYTCMEDIQLQKRIVSMIFMNSIQYSIS